MVAVMGRLRCYISLMLCLLFSSFAMAQEAGNASLELTESSDSTFQVTFHMGNITLVPAADGFVGLAAEGMVNLASHEGFPSLPQASRLIALPRGAELRLERWQEGDAEVLALSEGNVLSPWQGASVKDADPMAVEPDKEAYACDTFVHSGAPIVVENLGVMGDRQIFRITVHPVVYNPVGGKVMLCKSLSATLSTNHLSSILDAQPSRRYLIVSRPQFREGLQPFVRWKRQEGYEVTELYADTHLRDSVKALVSSEFGIQSSELWPRYVLLVGDVSQLQAFLGTTHPSGLGNHVTDLYYVEHTGDYLPDALLGRWPVNDTAELRAVVEKTLAYEQGLGLDTARLWRVLLVAGAESQEPAPVTTNGQVNYVSREVKLAHPAIDTLCYYNPASSGQRAAILNDIRQGAAWLNYTAHCSTAGWTNPSVTFSSIDTIDNPQPLLYINNCCLSNAFDGTCFGEQLLRKAGGGAIGVIGATNSTLWNEDYYWSVGPKYPFSLEPVYEASRQGAFDRWVGRGDDVQTLGALLAAGNLAVTAFGSPYDKFYWEIYCLLGDPSLMPWTGAPQAIELHATHGIHDGDGTLYLGGTAGATVTAMQHDTIIGVGNINANGLLALGLTRCLDTTPLVVTATGYGFRPRVDTLTVETVSGIGVALREVAVTDSLLTCRVENVGTVPLCGLRVVLSQLEVDSTVDALLMEQQAVVDTLLPHQSSNVSLPVQVEAIGQYPYWQAELYAWDSTEGMLCSLMLRQSMEVAYPTATFRLLELSGSEAHRLLPRHEYTLETTVEGTADVVDMAITALPTGDTLHSPFSTPDTLTHLHLEASLWLGNHRKDYNYWLVGGERQDSFEEGLANYPWQGGGTLPWQLDSIMPRSGRYSVRSGVIGHRQTSDLVLEVFLPQADTLSYWARVSSEERYDKLLFSVDGVNRGNARWGESDWKRYTTVIDAGRHILRWRYVKDESGSEGCDCAWIDDVSLPLALWDSAYGWFGDIRTLGLHDVNQEPSEIHLFPNPANVRVYIDNLPADGLAQLFDMQGRLLLTTFNSSLSVQDYPDGVYLLQVISAGGRHHSKLIISH